VATLGDITGKRILLPRSAQGGRELPAALSESGALVEEIALYTPTPAPIDEAARTMLTAGVDVVTFASGSAVRAFVDALRDDPRFTDIWSKVVVACIGPTTAQVARGLGMPVHIVAAEHTASGLVAAIVAYYEQGA
jgi:uroporphyrinogen III methyltransferase/synthase